MKYTGRKEQALSILQESPFFEELPEAEREQMLRRGGRWAPNKERILSILVGARPGSKEIELKKIAGEIAGHA